MNCHPSVSSKHPVVLSSSTTEDGFMAPLPDTFRSYLGILSVYYFLKQQDADQEPVLLARFSDSRPFCL